MFKTLLKLQFTELFGTMMGGSKNRKNKARGVVARVLLISLYVLLLAMFFLLFFGLFFLLALSLEADSAWLYFTVTVIGAMLICVLMSIFATYTQLFVSRDNELLLSMPIRPHNIVLSRMVALLLFNFMSSFIVIIPAAVIYPIFHKFTPLGILGFAVIAILIPFVSLAISAFLSYLFGLLVTFVKNKNLLKVILSLIGITVYFVVYFSFIQILPDEEDESFDINLSPAARSLKASAPVLYYIGASVSEGKMLYLLFITLISVSLFALCVWLISATFVRMTTTKRTVNKREYVEKKQDVRHPVISMMLKDIRMFFSNASYMLNSGIGLVLCVLVSVVALVNRKILLTELNMEGISGAAGAAMAIMIIGFMISMCQISAVSVSLEAKTLWQLQSMPIHPGGILVAKSLAQTAISMPPILVSVILLNIALPMDIGGRIFSFVLPIVMVIFSGFFGALINLWFPKFNWINETVAIKQSASVMICMLGTMIIFFALGIVGFILALLLPIIFLIYASLATLLLVGITALMIRYFYRGGAYRLSFINQ